MKCYKVLFNKKGIIKNIAFYIVAAIILLHIIVIIIFYNNQRYSLNNKIKEIIFGIKNWILVKQNKNQKNNKTTSFEQILKKQNINLKKYIKNKTKIKHKNKIYKNIECRDDKKAKLFPQINYNFYNKIINKCYCPLNKSSKKVNMFANKFLKTDNLTKKIVHKNKNNETNKKIINNQDILKNVKKLMKYNDEELNSLNYQNALIYDKRTYCEYYISLLKTKNNLIFSFCYNNDYNSKIIKIDLFFIGFTLFFTVNALFFDDSIMHKIYEDKGSFNLLYQLPQIIYSFFISSILNMILEFLSLSEGSILNLKNNKDKRYLRQRVAKLNKVLEIKFISYFILSFILLLFFCYYLSMFCSVYRNTQSHLIKDTLISFILSFIYPFGIYLIPGIFRIPSLSKSKNKKLCLYNFSKVLQML